MFYVQRNAPACMPTDYSRSTISHYHNQWHSQCEAVTINNMFEVLVHSNFNICRRGYTELWFSTGCTFVHITEPWHTFAKRVAMTSETCQIMRFRVFELVTFRHSCMASRVCHHIRQLSSPSATTFENLSKG